MVLCSMETPVVYGQLVAEKSGKTLRTRVVHFDLMYEKHRYPSVLFMIPCQKAGDCTVGKINCRAVWLSIQ